MAGKFVSMKNLKFTLHNVTGLDFLSGYNEKSVNMILNAAFDFSERELHPLFEEMDRVAPELDGNTVKVHPAVKKIMSVLGEDGWIAASFPEKWGGENMPTIILHAINFIFGSANYSASVYPILTSGAAKLIDSFGSEDLQNRFIPSMVSGKWQGTMALTEPEAGTSLGDLQTAAYEVSENVFRIKGEKIFISAGDHNCVENIVHLMLARIDGAPEGVKGISLFVVPKLREKQGGGLESNDVHVTQVFHKMGYRGAPITALSMGDNDDCLGWLVGEKNKGLSYMFQMMNGARLEVGTGAASIASASFLASLEYTKMRRQGRTISGQKKETQDFIIEHSDVKRMLLFQRAVSEGALSLILQCGRYEDIVHMSSDQKDKKEHFLLELLTPVAKTYSSEMGILSTSMSIQCFGGYGYCEDFPVEQHFRDIRIHPIHEGTTGIQGMDLLGRKVVMHKGKALKLLTEEIEQTIKEALEYDLKKYCDLMQKSLATVIETTKFLGKLAATDGVDAFLENSTLYLEIFGHMVFAWQWLKMGVCAKKMLAEKSVKKADQAFYEGKLMVLKYFFSHELPKIQSASETIKNMEKVMLETQPVHFSL